MYPCFSTGPGITMAAVLVFTFLSSYFEKYFALASSFLYAGRPIGTLVFAPLTQV